MGLEPTTETSSATSSSVALSCFLEPEAEPAGSEAAVALGLFPRDQCRQLERLGDRHPADLARGHLGEHEVVAFQRPPEDRSRMALRGRRCSSLGQDGDSDFKAPVRTPQTFG
jgi:hypothetical protein